MAVIIFIATSQRVAVRGSCLEPDLLHVVDALEAFGRTSSDLILDLKRTSVMSWLVAESILLTCDHLRTDGVRVQLRMTPGSAVERMIDAVRGTTAHGGVVAALRAGS